MRFHRGFTAIACLLLLGGCTQQAAGHALPAGSSGSATESSEAGSPGTDPGDSNGPLPASDIRVDEPRSANVCSLVEKSSLKRLGTVKMSPGLRFSSCEASVSSCVSSKDPDELSESEKKQLSDEQRKCLSRVNDPISGVVDVTVSLEDTRRLGKIRKASPDPGTDAVPIEKLSEKTAAGQPALKFPESKQLCAYLLPLDQQAALLVNAAPRNDSTSGNDLCSIAQNALENAAETIEAGKVTRMDRADDSFAFIDLCEKITPGDVALDGVDWSHTFVGDFGRSCTFTAGKHTGVFVYLAPQYAPMPDATGAKGPKQVAGEPTWTVPHKSDDANKPSSCNVKTTRPDELPEDPMTKVETANVVVVRSDGDAKPCAEAKDIASAVWPKISSD